MTIKLSSLNLSYRISRNRVTSTATYWDSLSNTSVQRKNFSSFPLEDCQLMLEEGNAEELSQLTYPFGRGVNISFGIKDVPQLHQKLLEANYPIYRPLTKREFRVGEQYIYPHEFAVLDPDGYFLRFSE